MPEDSLKDKTVKGVGWSAVDNISSYAVTFVVGLILARLLTPDDYGLIGIISIFTAICGCFINAGFGTALIRKKDATEADFCTVFVCNLIMSIALYWVLFLLAPYIATYFRREELVSLARVTSLSMIISAFSIVQSTRLTKRIDFKSQTMITIASAIVRSIVGLAMAFSGFGVWAIVGQSLSGSITSTILLCYVNKWIPRLRFSKESFRYLFGFGSKLLISDIITTIWNQVYNVVIGRYYQPATLGQYTRAKMFDGLLSSNLTVVIQRVTFPVLSELQDDKERLKSGYRRVIRTTMLISFLGSMIMAAVAKPMIIVLVGPQWIEASYYLQIVLFSTMLFPLHSINLNMLLVLGRSDLFLKLEIYKKTIAVIPIVLGIFIGIYWMLVSSVIVGVIHYYINAYYSGKLLGYTFFAQVKDIMPSFAISFAGAFVAYITYLLIEYFIYYGNDFWPNLSALIFLMVLSSAISILLFFSTRNPEFYELKGIAFNIISKIKINHAKV